MVVQHINRDGEVSCVEGVVVVPPLRAKFAALCYTGVKETKGKQHGVELLFPRAQIQSALIKRKERQKSVKANVRTISGKTKVFSTNLIEVVEGSMQTGIHARRWLICDFYSIFKQTSRNYMLLRAQNGLSSYENPVAGMTLHCCCFQKIIQCGQPAGHKVYILKINILGSLQWKVRQSRHPTHWLILVFTAIFGFKKRRIIKKTFPCALKE